MTFALNVLDASPSGHQLVTCYLLAADAAVSRMTVLRRQ
jgi:hypothetical protein